MLRNSRLRVLALHINPAIFCSTSIKRRCNSCRLHFFASALVRTSTCGMPVCSGVPTVVADPKPRFSTGSRSLPRRRRGECRPQRLPDAIILLECVANWAAIHAETAWSTRKRVARDRLTRRRVLAAGGPGLSCCLRNDNLKAI